MKITIWTVMPNHYQASFFESLREQGVDLRVHYYGAVDSERLLMGWRDPDELPPGERYVKRNSRLDELQYDWRERLHIVPGCGEFFLRRLATTLSQGRTPWAHWSEPAHPGWRWYLGYPVKRWYASLLNRFALGAFGNGVTACRDISKWGVRTEKIALLTYSNPMVNLSVDPDSACELFRKSRKAFVFVGSHSQRKGTDVILRAFARVAEATNNWVLLLVGPDDSSGYYARTTMDLGIAERVFFRGPVPPLAVASVLKCASVFVLPSRFDGWGVVLNEAARAGMAVVASDQCGAAYHLIEPGENGFRVSAGDVTSLTSAMMAYVNDPTLATVHGVESCRLADDYGPGRNAKRFLAAIASWRAMEDQLRCE